MSINFNKNILNKKIFCKNFILFILFLNFFKFSNTSVFVKPTFKKKFTILNAPYRYKLSKSDFYFSRYNILLIINIQTNINYCTINLLILIFKKLFLFLKKFDVNLCHQNYFKIFFSSHLNSNFLIENFK